MLWFNSEEKRKKMEFMQTYVPTSKAQLLQVALFYSKGDLKKAQEMFDFYNSNIELPDFDPVTPTTMQQVKETAGNIFSWVKENQNELAQGYQFIYSIIKNKGALPIVEDTAGALPSINE